MTMVTVRLEADLLAAADAKAAALGVSRSDLIKQGLQLMLGQAPPPVKTVVGRKVELAAVSPRTVSCPHPKERREFIKSIGRSRCLDCKVLLP